MGVVEVVCVGVFVVMVVMIWALESWLLVLRRSSCIQARPSLVGAVVVQVVMMLLVVLVMMLVVVVVVVVVLVLVAVVLVLLGFFFLLLCFYCFYLPF